MPPTSKTTFMKIICCAHLILDGENHFWILFETAKSLWLLIWWFKMGSLMEELCTHHHIIDNNELKLKYAKWRTLKIVVNLISQGYNKSRFSYIYHWVRNKVDGKKQWKMCQKTQVKWRWVEIDTSQEDPFRMHV